MSGSDLGSIYGHFQTLNGFFLVFSFPNIVAMLSEG